MVRNLSYQTDEKSLRNFFEKEGLDIMRLNLPRHPDGKPKGIAFVTFETEDQRDAALD